MKQELRKELKAIDTPEMTKDNYLEQQRQRDPQEFVKHMNTSYESFFFQREYTRKNFDFYLQVLASQYKDEEALKVLSRMQAMGIRPDGAQYAKVMQAFAKTGKVEQVEKLWKEVKTQQIVLNPIIYNSLVLAYCKANRALEAEKVVDEMREEGIKPDVITYTTMIDAYKRIKDYNKVSQSF